MTAIVTHHIRLGETEHKADRVENIGFARTIETSNRVEGRVPARYLCPNWVRLEPLEDEFGDVHGGHRAK